MSMVCTAAGAPLGVSVTITRVDAAAAVARRLQSFGLRPGARLTCIQKTSGGRVISLANAQIALGHEVLAGVQVRVDS